MLTCLLLILRRTPFPAFLAVLFSLLSTFYILPSQQCHLPAISFSSLLPFLTGSQTEIFASGMRLSTLLVMELRKRKKVRYHDWCYVYVQGLN
ncbi:hypothetical protein BJV82DRAFT_640500 [Fennellomyces sp. T-0311]|nr:hypothetical protein BJV82DRAFT_640500 [Fennellomyces sp. T-0311]